MTPLSTDPLDICPHCHADLSGAEIPAEDRQHHGGSLHYSHRIGMVSRDRIERWCCPECDGSYSILDLPEPMTRQERSESNRSDVEQEARVSRELGSL